MLTRCRVVCSLCPDLLAAARLFVDNCTMRYVHTDMANALSIASGAGLYAYDAYFLDCAARYRAPLLTLDRSLRRAAERLDVMLVNLEV